MHHRSNEEALHLSPCRPRHPPEGRRPIPRRTVPILRAFQCRRRLLNRTKDATSYRRVVLLAVLDITPRCSSRNKRIRIRRQCIISRPCHSALSPTREEPKSFPFRPMPRRRRPPLLANSCCKAQPPPNHPIMRTTTASRLRRRLRRCLAAHHRPYSWPAASRTVVDHPRWRPM